MKNIYTCVKRNRNLSLINQLSQQNNYTNIKTLISTNTIYMQMKIL